MPRRQRPCKKSPQLTDCSTQTDSTIENQPRRSSLSKLTILNEHKESVDSSEFISIENPSLPIAPRKSGTISKPPSSYNVFVKPITNNEKANSTLADVSNNTIPMMLSDPEISVNTRGGPEVEAVNMNIANLDIIDVEDGSVSEESQECHPNFSRKLDDKPANGDEATEDQRIRKVTKIFRIKKAGVVYINNYFQAPSE